MRGLFVAVALVSSVLMSGCSSSAEKPRRESAPASSAAAAVNTTPVEDCAQAQSAYTARMSVYQGDTSEPSVIEARKLVLEFCGDEEGELWLSKIDRVYEG